MILQLKSGLWYSARFCVNTTQRSTQYDFWARIETMKPKMTSGVVVMRANKPDVKVIPKASELCLLASQATWCSDEAKAAVAAIDALMAKIAPASEVQTEIPGPEVAMDAEVVGADATTG